MKIVFYSSNSNNFDKNTFIIKVRPDIESIFQTFTQKYPEHEFICISQAPAMFMPENSVILLKQELSADDFAEEILKLKPDFAIAMSFWVNPYDWLTVNDGIIAEKLKANGIQTICHNIETGLVCFDKWRTHQKLLQLGIKVPEAIFVDHDLYFCAGSHKEVINNVYKASVYSQIRNLKLPLIIKDTAGLSSYGMTVVNTYGECQCYLNSKRNNSNRIVEEYINGQQFGVEIYGTPGNYSIFPALTFSLNQYGITSPKQSAKFGPVEMEQKLKDILLKLAETLQFYGCTQIDLIKSQNEWYIIEINPRQGGMSYSYASLMGLSIFEIIYKTCVLKENLTHSEKFENKKILNVKLPLLDDEKMKEILCLPEIVMLNQTNDLAAKQEREKGFCECIIVGENLEIIQETLKKLKEYFPEEATILQSETILK